MRKFTKYFTSILLIIMLIIVISFKIKSSICFDLVKEYSKNKILSSHYDLTADFYNIPYKDIESNPMYLDIYKSKYKPSEPSPVIIYVHGGAWTSGSKKIPNVMIPFLNVLRKNGFSIVSISYELMDDNINFNKQICDVKDAIRWVNKNKDIYNFNCNNIGLVGFSAGAHLSLMASYSDENEFIDDYELSSYSSNVNYVIDLFGPTDLSTLNPINDYYDFSTVVSNLGETENIIYEYSPINHLKENLPSTLIVHSKSDKLVPYNSNSLSLFECSSKLNNDIKLVTLDNMEHSLKDISANDIKKIILNVWLFINSNI